MSAKLGRPKLRNPNNVSLTIKINAVMREELNRYCLDHKITVGEALRQGFELLLRKELKDVEK